MESPGNTDRSPETSFQDATNMVLGALSNIRKTPELRRNFVSGNRSALEAVDEVRNIFQSKTRKPAKKSRAIDTSCVGNREEKKRKRKYFKHVIGCFSEPNTNLNPSRQEWDSLYAIGLGKAWKGQTEACIPGHLTAKEFHALILSMFPGLVSTPYELCKLGGPYNNEVKVLDDALDSSAVFIPRWSPDSLRPLIGKAQLLIRPQRSILEKAKELKISKVCVLRYPPIPNIKLPLIMS